MEEQEMKTLKTAIKEKDAKWIAVENPISKLSAEKRRNLLGSLPEPRETKKKEEGDDEKKDEDITDVKFGAATAWDWRNALGGKNWTTTIKNQGGCGSCIAFGTIGAMECQLKILRNDPNINPDFSEAHIFFCNGRQCNKGDPNYGWWRSAALDYLRDIGAPDDPCYPYSDVNQQCKTCSDWQQRATKITGWKTITSRDEMKSWISTKGPLVASYTVYTDFFYYGGGVYEHVWGIVEGGHCVTIVGYNDGDQCWICKNSWGSWGESGFFRIKYGQCGIDSSMDSIQGIWRSGWQNGKKIIGLWAIDEDRNAWVYVQDVGWRKLANSYDNAVIDLMTKAAHAKAEDRYVNFYEEGVEGGTIYIKQMYTW